MTKLLLDYRWELSAALDNSEVQFALMKFVNLVRRTGLSPAPFVEEQQQLEMWQELEQRPLRNGGWQQIKEFLSICSRPKGSICRAIPDKVTPGFPDNWTRALRDQLGDLSDWRNPHIVVPESRLPEWAPDGGEVAIRCEQCGDQPASGPHHRVLAVLERYDTHEFAISDLDPWDLQRLHPPIPDRPRQHPALLPKPRLPTGFTLENFHEHLKFACGHQWEIDGRYYFIPPKDFNPLGVDKETWRKGRAFQYDTAPGTDKSGPVDCNGIVWSWDENERHWDVQTKPQYIRISHTGKRLPDPN
jgi:hypothetical protein